MEGKTKTEKSDEIVVTPANVRASAAVTRRDKTFEQFLVDRRNEDAQDPMDAHERIIRQVLAADSVDAVLTPTEVKQARDIIGMDIVIVDFDLSESEFDAGSPLYANLACLFPPDGSPEVVNCGHKKVLAQLVRLKELDAFPVAVKFITRGNSAHGTPMLELTKSEFELKPEMPF
jgi:hypothetical protein